MGDVISRRERDRLITFEIDEDKIISVTENFVLLDPESVVNFSNCSDSVEFID